MIDFYVNIITKGGGNMQATISHSTDLINGGCNACPAVGVRHGEHLPYAQRSRAPDPPCVLAGDHAARRADRRHVQAIGERRTRRWPIAATSIATVASVATAVR